MTVAQPEGTHLAHFNWATLKGDLGSPEVAGFETAVPRVNALAERSPGFVWRDGEEARHACEIGWPLFTANPRTIASFSVWERPEDLTAYVYRTVHGAFLKRREEWFVAGSGGHVLWWVPAGTIPTIVEARDAVERLDRSGPSPEVFGFAQLRASAATA